MILLTLMLTGQSQGSTENQTHIRPAKPVHGSRSTVVWFLVSSLFTRLPETGKQGGLTGLGALWVRHPRYMATITVDH